MQLHKDITHDRINHVLKEFTSEIYQLPPLKASVKRALRKRTVYYLRLLEISERKVLFRIACQSGTYIRKICYDVGEVLGPGAHMRELRRIRAGSFHADNNLVTLHDLKYAVNIYQKEKEEGPLRQVILPIESAFQHIPKIFVRDSAVDAICHGASLAIPGVVKLDSDIKIDTPIALFTLKGEVIALSTSLMSSEEIIEKEKGIAATTNRVIMPPGIYPKGWKTYQKKKE